MVGARRHRWVRQLARAAFIASVICALGVQATSSTAQVASEYDVKAAFLYNFAKFVDWPVQNFPRMGTPFTLCVFGDDPFGGLLERAVHGKTVQDRPISILHPIDEEEVTQCQLLFVTSESVRLGRLLAVLKQSPVLLVGDTEDIAYGGGMIAFRMEGNRVRFIVNQDAVARTGLSISSQLLKVADRVLTSQAAE